jgi:hypothetical protein
LADVVVEVEGGQGFEYILKLSEESSCSDIGVVSRREDSSIVGNRGRGSIDKSCNIKDCKGRVCVGRLRVDLTEAVVWDSA